MHFWFPVAPPRPDPPTSVSVTSVGTTTITIMWVAPSASNNISTYSLVLTENGGSTITVSAPGGTTSYNFTGVEEYRVYFCMITAVSIYGPVSVTTTPVSVTTLIARKIISVMTKCTPLNPFLLSI